MRSAESERVDFFDALMASYQQAQDRLGLCQWQGRLAGRGLLLKGAGSMPLSRLVPALPYGCPSSDADLTIHLWDGAGSLPLLIRSLLQAVTYCKHEMLDVRYELKGFNDSRISTVYRLGPCQILSVLDRQRAQGLYWVDDASLLPYWELGSPLQTLLNWWAEDRGLQYLHAAAVGSAQGAILLTGAGGSGKSTTALACLAAGMGYLADDYCLAAEGKVYSLYGTAKLVGQADLDRFPALASWVQNPQRDADDKLLLDVAGYRPEQMVLEAPLKAVVVPRLGAGVDSRLQRISASAALLALAPTTLFQLPGTHQSSLSRMAAILRGVPTYRLELGTDVSQLPDLLGGLL